MWVKQWMVDECFTKMKSCFTSGFSITKSTAKNTKSAVESSPAPRGSLMIHVDWLILDSQKRSDYVADDSSQMLRVWNMYLYHSIYLPQTWHNGRKQYSIRGAHGVFVKE